MQKNKYRTHTKQKYKYTDQNLLEGTDARDLVARMDHSGRFTLGSHQDNVDHIGCRRNRADALEIVDGHLVAFC